MVIHIVTKKQRGYYILKVRSMETGENLMKAVVHSKDSAVALLQHFCRDWAEGAESDFRLDDRAGVLSELPEQS